MHKKGDEHLIWPQDLQIIESVETLKVVADPLRLRILAMLRREPATARQIARELDTPIKKLYYHLGLLEEHALIRVRSTRLVSGILEKQYEPTAYRITVARGLLSPASPEPPVPESLDVFLSFVLDHARAEIKKSIAAGLIDPTAPTPAEGGLSLGRLWMRLTREQRDELERRMMDLHMEYAERQAPPETPGTQYYELLIGVYPTIEPSDAAAEQEQ